MSVQTWRNRLKTFRTHEALNTVTAALWNEISKITIANGSFHAIKIQDDYNFVILQSDSDALLSWAGDDNLLTNTTLVDQDSNSGTSTLYVASTAGYSVGDVIVIDKGGSREEYNLIITVNADNLVLKNNLSYTHTLVNADSVGKVLDFSNSLTLMGDASFHNSITLAVPKGKSTSRVNAVWLLIKGSASGTIKGVEC